MTFLEALYGSQYREITQNGKDGAKGRFNGNIFLSAFILLIIMVIIAIYMKVSESFNHQLTESIKDNFGNYRNSGRTAGKLLAIPAMGICYLIIINTIGSVSSYEKIVERFNQLPEEVQDKANKKVLVPFFILLGLLIVSFMF